MNKKTILMHYIQKCNLVMGCFFVLTACSHGVLSFPPASIKYFENGDKTGQAVRMETWGVSIDTNLDSGLSMGHVVKTYFYEGESSKNVGSRAIKNNFELKEIVDPKTIKINTSSPYAYAVKSQGVLFNTNPQRTGVSIGVSVYERVYLPLGFDGVLYINSKLGSKKPGEFYIKRGDN